MNLVILFTIISTQLIRNKATSTEIIEVQPDTIDSYVSVHLTTDTRNITADGFENNGILNNEWRINYKYNNEALNDWPLSMTLSSFRYGFRTGELSSLKISMDGSCLGSQCDALYGFGINDKKYVTFVHDFDGQWKRKLNSAATAGIYIHPECGVTSTIASGNASALISSSSYNLRKTLSAGNTNNWHRLTTSPNNENFPVTFEFINDDINNEFSVTFTSSEFESGLQCTYGSSVQTNADFQFYVTPDDDNELGLLINSFNINGSNIGAITTSPTQHPTKSPTADFMFDDINKCNETRTYQCTIDEDCYINCVGKASCQKCTFQCPDNFDCVFNVIGQQALESSKVYGGTNGNVEIYCSGFGACRNMNIYDTINGNINVHGVDGWQVTNGIDIYGQNAASINLTTVHDDGNSIRWGTIWCPISGDNCNVYVKGTSQIITGTHFYSLESFTDLSLTCVGDESDDCAGAIMHCGPNYMYTCEMELIYGNNEWGCTNTSAQCHSYTFLPTKSPTSLFPTNEPTSISPSYNPSESPSKPPSKYPTTSPSKNPTLSPSKYPTISPTKSPSHYPTALSNSPTRFPTITPTNNPTVTNAIIVKNLNGLNDYYLTFVLLNMDDCLAYVDSVQILQDNVYRDFDRSSTEWIGGGQYAPRYEFDWVDNTKFSDMLPITIRLLFNTSDVIILSDIIANLNGSSQFISESGCTSINIPSAAAGNAMAVDKKTIDSQDIIEQVPKPQNGVSIVNMVIIFCVSIVICILISVAIIIYFRRKHIYAENVSKKNIEMTSVVTETTLQVKD